VHSFHFHLAFIISFLFIFVNISRSHVQLKDFNSYLQNMQNLYSNNREIKAGARPKSSTC